MVTRKSVAVAVAVLLAALAWWATRPGPDDGGAPRRPRNPVEGGALTAVTARVAAPRPEDEPGPAGESPNATAGVAILVESFEGEPLAGARVEALRPIQTGVTSPWTILGLLDSRSAAAASAVTGPDGRAEVRGLAPGAWTVVASREGAARASRTVFLEAGLRAETLVLVLGRGHALEGRVLEADGRPVAGACVVVGEEWGQVTRTGAEGRYAFRGLSRGRTLLLAGRRGGMPVDAGGVEIPAVDRFDIVLPPAAVLAGTVTDGETGAPIPDVLVQAGTWWGGCGAGSATTDAGGRYAMESIPPGPVNHITAEKVGWLLPPPPAGPAGFQVSLRPGETTVRDLALVRAGRLEGVVSGPDGPLAGAGVYAGVRKGGGARNRSAITDARGRYEFPVIEDGSVQVTAMMPGYLYPEWWEGVRTRDLSPCTVEVRPGETATHDIRLTRGATVRGRVETVEGAPVEGARVGGSAVMAAGAVSRADGSFDLTGPGPDVSEWIVRREGFVEGTLRVPGEVDRTGEPLVVRLARCPRVQGTVVSLSGAPLEEAFVKAFVVTGRVLRTPGGGSESLWSETAPVRADGTYALVVPWAEQGQFTVFGYAAGHAEGAYRTVAFEPAREEYAADLVLEPARTARGRVVRRGTDEPVAGARVKSGTAFGAVADAEGRFSISTVVPAASPFTFSVWAEGFVTVNVTADPLVPEIAVAMDPALEIRGTVVFADGRPVPRAIVEARGAVTRRHLPGPDGALCVDQLPPGEYRVVAEPYLNEGDAPFEPAAVEAVPAGTKGLRIVVQPATGRGGRIAGKVLGSDRRPLNGVLVVAVGAGEPGARQRVQATTDPDGTFSLTGLSAGAFALTVNPPGSTDGPYAGGRGFAPATREGIAAGTTDLEVVLEKGLTLEGTLLDADGRPLASVVLVAGWQTATTDAEGRFAIGGLAPGEYAIAVYPSSKDCVVLVQRTEKFSAGSTGIRLQAESR